MNDFDNAQLFKCIVEQGSLAKAAKAFNINPSAVSKRLSQLEHSLQTQLINRTTRRISLTEAGHYFYSKVNHLQYEWQAVLDETSSLSKEVKGNLRITSPQPLFSRFLMPLIAEFQKVYPEVSFDFVHQQIDQLPSMDADISISKEIDHYDSNKMVARPFYQYQNQLYASPTYLARHSAIESWRDIGQHPCLVNEAQKHKAMWHFTEHTIDIEKSISVNNAEIMISAATHGMGIIYLPPEILGKELKEKTLVPVLPELHSRSFHTCAYYLKTEFIPRKLRAFLDFLITRGNLK